MSTQRPIGPVVAALRTVLRDTSFSTAALAAPPRPFITITRQEGAGAIELAQSLTTHLNQADADPPWKAYDRELIEQVAQDHGIAQDLIASLPDRPHSLLLDLAEGMRFDSSRPTDEAVYAKVIATIRSLARLGHSIIVGRGGVFCTQDLPAGIHLQLVAPLSYRLERFAQAHELNPAEARRRLEQIEQNRDAFIRRFWPKVDHLSDRFTLTINTAKVPVHTQVAIVGQLLDALRPWQVAS